MIYFKYNGNMNGSMDKQKCWHNY